MNSVIFSSFSRTTLKDLYYLNVGSYHKHIYFFEIKKGLIENYEKNIPIEEIEFIYSDSYILGLATDNPEFLKIDLKDNKIVLLDNNSNQTHYRKMKDFFYIVYRNNTISVLCKPNAKIYYDDFDSLSWLPVPVFDEVSISDTVTFDLQNVKVKP